MAGDGFHLLLLILGLIAVWAIYRQSCRRTASRNARRTEADKGFLVQEPVDPSKDEGNE